MILLIDRIICEIREAQSHGLYLSALTLALTLPDTCGKAEYPHEKCVGKRYKNWCNEYVIIDRCDSPCDFDMPYQNEDVIYNLRNSLLHQSTPNIEKTKIKEERCRVDKFELIISDDNIASGDKSVVAYGKDMRIVYRELSIYVSHLCYILCSAAESYYHDNREKFGFIQYSIVDERAE